MPTPAPDIYADREEAVPEPEEPKAASEDDNGDGDEEGKEGSKTSESATGLLSKSFFGDKELTPGKTCKVRVEKIYGDQVSVSYVAHDAKADDGDDDEPPKQESVYED